MCTGSDTEPTLWVTPRFTVQFSAVAQSCPTLFVTPWTAAHQAPLSMEFSRQEYWSGLPFPPPGVLLDAGIEHVSLTLAGGFFITESAGEPLLMNYLTEKQSIQARIPEAQDY